MTDNGRKLLDIHTNNEAIVVGSVVEVIAKTSGHRFSIGNKYLVIEAYDSHVYRLRNQQGLDCRSVMATEVRKATNEEASAFLELAEKSEVFIQREQGTLDFVNRVDEEYGDDEPTSEEANG